MKKGSNPLCRSCVHVLCCTLALCATLFTPWPLGAQPGIAWVKAIASPVYSAGTDIAVDPFGNVIVASIYRDALAFDDDPNFHISNRGKTDIALIKVDAAGSLLWMRTIGGVGDDKVFRIATDARGDIYLTGSFERVIRFHPEDESHTLESAGKEDMFLARFDADGEIQWSVRAGGARSDQGIGLALDSAGHVYASGFFEETAFFGAEDQVALNSTGQLDAYLVKYTSNGTLAWARALGGVKRDIASAIAVNEGGQVFVTGVTRGPGAFLDIADGIVQGAPVGRDDLFLARYAPTGTLEKLVYSGGPGFDAANAIDIDANGNVFIAGYFEDRASIVDLSGQRRSLTGHSFDLFIARFNAAGQITWAKRAGGDRWDNAYDLDVDGSGNAYVTGLFRKSADFTGNEETDIEGTGEANAFVAKYAPNGSVVGLRMIDGAKSEGAGVAFNTAGAVFLTGLFLDRATFDDRLASLSSTAFNSFIAKYESQGLEKGLLDGSLHTFENDVPLFTVTQNFPNPFVDKTRFGVDIRKQTPFRLLVYDSLGRLVDEIDKGQINAGFYQFFYDASHLARGIYFYTLETPTHTVTRSMTRLR